MLFPFIGKPIYGFSFGLQHLILHSANYCGYGFCFVYGSQHSSSYFHKYMVPLWQPTESNELYFFLAILVHFSPLFYTTNNFPWELCIVCETMRSWENVLLAGSFPQETPLECQKNHKVEIILTFINQGFKHSVWYVLLLCCKAI